MCADESIMADEPEKMKELIALHKNIIDAKDGLLKASQSKKDEGESPRVEFKYAYKDGTYLYRSYELAETKKEIQKKDSVLNQIWRDCLKEIIRQPNRLESLLIFTVK